MQKKTSNFEDLQVWKSAHLFVLSVYKTTKLFPKDELFGLTSQFRRAAISVAANIVEGYKKRGVKDKLRFYNISEGSADECRYYTILSKDLEYISVEEFDYLNSQILSVSKQLSAYSTAIERNSKFGGKSKLQNLLFSFLSFFY
ncbi:MAG: four helix bundle protein [Porphyromonadaceae bacterium]|jgi:four helix bundle protein|nr:four helix bundle protein [Porphyromonadaceae bacterium]